MDLPIRRRILGISGALVRQHFHAVVGRMLQAAVIPLFVFAACLHVPRPALGGDVVRLAAFDYPPFYFQENDEVTGIAVDLIRELFSRLGRDVVVDMLPLKRALTYVEAGSRDGIMILIKTPERQEYMEYTESVMTVRGLLWTAADAPGNKVGSEFFRDLQSRKIGVTRGYSYGTDFDEMLQGMDVNVANSDLSNFRMLVSPRIDVFPCNEIVAGGIFKRHPELAGEVVPSEQAFVEWVLHMGVGKASPLKDSIPAINAALAAMRKEGLIDAIVKKYIR